MIDKEKEMGMAKISIVIQACLAASIFYLGFTIYSFTNTVNKVVDTYPAILADFNQTTANLDIEGWLDVANKYAEIAPNALKVAQDANVTASEINKTMVSVNKTVSSVDEKLPKILSEVHGVRTEMVPAVLKESASLRQALPPMITKIDDIVEKSEEISRNATEGAVKGVILSPINLLKDAGSGLKSKVSQ